MKSSRMLQELAGADSTPLRPDLLRFFFRTGNVEVRRTLVRLIQEGSPRITGLTHPERLEIQLAFLPTLAQSDDALDFADVFCAALCSITTNAQLDSDGNLERLFGILGALVESEEVRYDVADVMILERIYGNHRGLIDRIDRLRVPRIVRHIIGGLRELYPPRRQRA